MNKVWDYVAGMNKSFGAIGFKSYFSITLIAYIRLGIHSAGLVMVGPHLGCVKGKCFMHKGHNHVMHQG